MVKHRGLGTDRIRSVPRCEGVIIRTPFIHVRRTPAAAERIMSDNHRPPDEAVSWLRTVCVVPCQSQLPSSSLFVCACEELSYSKFFTTQRCSVSSLRGNERVCRSHSATALLALPCGTQKCGGHYWAGAIFGMRNAF
jgi:hypothetical protein